MSERLTQKAFHRSLTDQKLSIDLYWLATRACANNNGGYGKEAAHAIILVVDAINRTAGVHHIWLTKHSAYELASTALH